MGVIAKLGDSLRNVVANLGTARDKQTGARYSAPTLTIEESFNAYRGAWLPRKIVEIPALDACRNWRRWQAEGEQISALEAEETRLGVQKKVLDCLTKARLWGGAAIYIGTGDSDPSKPLDPASVKKGGIRHLTVLTRRVLKAGDVDLDPESPRYGKPSFYELTSQTAGQVRIHPSRLVILIGAPSPDEEMNTGEERGWGDSVLTAIIDQIKQADSTAANIASLVFEAKIDVISIPNLMANLAGDTLYQQQLNERLTLAAIAKGINGALIIDSEEKYEQKSANFSNLKDLMLAFMQLVAGAADIPMTRLLGQSPGGLTSTGESDVRNYYDGVAAMQTLDMGPAMAVLDECLIRSALGDRPEEIYYDWRSLWQASDKDRADIGKTTADTIKTISDTGLIPEEVLGKVAVAMLTEAGVAPGLESEMKDYVAATPEEEEEEAIASITAGQPTEEGEGAAVTDAKPRPLYVQRLVINRDEIAAWAQSQGIPDLVDDLHVTIAASRQPIDWIKAGNASEWSDQRKDQLIIPEGGPRAVEPLGGMTAVLMFAAARLGYRHREILEAGATWDFHDYQPHISLTKAPVDLSTIEPYRGPIVLGPEVFEEFEE